MPLSEYEQRVLEQLEKDLGTDPKLGQAMSRAPKSRSRLTLSVLGVIAGLGVVLAGAIAQQPIIGIAGFALMIFAALWGMLAPTPKLKSVPRGDASASAGQSKGDFMRRVEDRFERRREQGDF